MRSNLRMLPHTRTASVRFEPDGTRLHGSHATVPAATPGQHRVEPGGVVNAQAVPPRAGFKPECPPAASKAQPVLPRCSGSCDHMPLSHASNGLRTVRRNEMVHLCSSSFIAVCNMTVGPEQLAQS